MQSHPLLRWTPLDCCILCLFPVFQLESKKAWTSRVISFKFELLGLW
ncbi:hypothetical protein GWI33_012369, partial [Rhynchophorus ferrugineus]